MAEFPIEGQLLCRRRFVNGCTATMALAAMEQAGVVTAATAPTTPDILAAYVTTRDPATAVKTVGHGEAFGGRWRTCRLTSQMWKGTAWTHELSMFLPDKVRSAGRMMLWIDGGGEKSVPGDSVTLPTKAVGMIAAVANAAGLPVAVVRQVPFQPMFGDLREDGLIAHTFVEFTKTGDPTWPLLLPMVKSAVEAMTAASVQAHQHWDAPVEEFVVTGASKRGWTTWLSAAVDDRVKGIVPMVIDMLSLGEHLKLQIDSFGKMSEQLADYTSRGIEALFATPRGQELAEIVDPYSYRDRYTMPKVIALGTNDPYWPLEACNLYYDGLPGPRWLSYCPNAGHGLPVFRVAAVVAAMGRHVAEIEPLPQVDWRFDNHAQGADCAVDFDVEPRRATLWTASSKTRDFRRAVWVSQPVPVDGGSCRISLPPVGGGFSAGFVELEFDRDPLPLMLTSGINVLQGS
jgi:PhoPQ-activated pathogenicity-related protein